MAGEPEPGLEEGRPGPGVGLPAWGVALGALMLAVAGPPDLGLFAGLFAAGVGVWYTVAPIADGEAGVDPDTLDADPSLTEESRDPQGEPIGKSVQPARRYSIVVIGLGLLACLIAVSRWRLG
jgi:hypothetical protein